MSGVTIAWEDVFSVVSQIKFWLIGIGVVLVAMIAALTLAGKAGKKRVGMIRAQSVIAAIALIAVLVNGILFGPMNDLLSTVTA